MVLTEVFHLLAMSLQHVLEGRAVIGQTFKPHGPPPEVLYQLVQVPAGPGQPHGPGYNLRLRRGVTCISLQLGPVV